MNIAESMEHTAHPISMADEEQVKQIVARAVGVATAGVPPTRWPRGLRGVQALPERWIAGDRVPLTFALFAADCGWANGCCGPSRSSCARWRRRYTPEVCRMCHMLRAG
jgi:hypothetical protein